MNYKMSFQEMQKLGMEKLSKQSPISLEKKREQYKNLKTQNSLKSKRLRS
jgi:hypothetical protein